MTSLAAVANVPTANRNGRKSPYAMKYRAMYPRLRMIWYRFISDVEFSWRTPAISQLPISRVRRSTTSGTTIGLVTLLARYPYIVSSQ